MTTKFWMVYLSGGRAPSCRHPSLEDAKNEAERLCRTHHSEAFVLEAVGAVEEKEAPVDWTLDLPMPGTSTPEDVSTSADASDDPFGDACRAQLRRAQHDC